MNDKYDRLIDILLQVKNFASLSYTDVGWSKYNSSDEMIAEIDSLIDGLSKKEMSVLKEIKMLLAPTGSFQEVSLSSGWGHEFLALSDLVDKIL